MATPAAPMPPNTIAAKIGDTVTLTFTPSDPNTDVVSSNQPDASGKFSTVPVVDNITTFPMPDISKLPPKANFLQENLYWEEVPAGKGVFSYHTTSNPTEIVAVVFQDISKFSGYIKLINL